MIAVALIVGAWGGWVFVLAIRGKVSDFTTGWCFGITFAGVLLSLAGAVR